MNDSASMLDQIVPGNHIFWIIIFDVFKWPVFPVLCFEAVHDRHGNLDIRVICIISYENKITLQFTDSAHTDVVSL